MKSNIISKEIAPNIYWVEKENKSLLYAPFKSSVVVGSRAWIVRKIIRFLADTHNKPSVISLPTTVTLDITHKCPLECVYCSVDSGKDDEVLKLDTSLAAINFIFENAKTLAIRSVGVVFGGGGEPSLGWEVLTRSVEHAINKSKESDMDLQIMVATGGILNSSKIKWLVDHVTHIALSFDGPEEVQDVHRPLRGGKKSFAQVVQTARSLQELKANFSIRAAISDLNSNLVELVDFFSQFNPAFLNFQPVVVCGRCHTTGWRGLNPDRFIEEFKKARQFADEKGLPLIFPGTRIDRIIPEACHAYNGTGFVVTSRGLVSSCERVLFKDEQLANLFIYGEYYNGKLQVDNEKLEKLKTLRVEKIPYCINCFCRWHCCGGCLNDHLSQSENQNNPFSPRTNAMCYITREIVWYVLSK